MALAVSGALHGCAISEPAGSRTPSPAVEDVRFLVQEGKNPEAEAQARALLDQMSAEFGGSSQELADLIDVLVESLWRQGKANEAETRELAERARTIREQGGEPDGTPKARSLRNLAEVERQSGRAATSESLYRQALEMVERVSGRDSPEVEPYLTGVANALLNSGGYREARSLYERALSIRLKELGVLDHPILARNHYNLAIVLRNLGEFPESRLHYQRALEIFLKSEGPDHPRVAYILNGIGLLDRESGNYTEAIVSFERALEIRESTPQAGYPPVATILNNMALTLRDMGDYEGARRRFLEALERREAALRPDHPLIAQSKHNLGVVLLLMGDRPGAQELFEHALRIRRAELGDDHPAVATTLQEYADMFAEVGDYSEAKLHYQEALRIWSHNPDHHYARALNGLAHALVELNDNAEARALYEQSLAIRTKTLGAEHPSVGEVLNNLAALLVKMDLTAEALRLALQAETISREHLVLTARSLSERQALRYASVRTPGLDLALSIVGSGSGAAPADVRDAWDALIRSRALVLDEMALRNQIAGTMENPEARELLQELSSARKRLADLTVRKPDPHHPEIYRELLDEARQNKERLERSLAEVSAAFRKERQDRRKGFSDVAAALASGEALVAFARYRMDKGESAYLAFVLVAGEDRPQVVNLGDAEEVEGDVTRWRTEAGSPAIGRSGNERQRSYRIAAEKLGRRIWDPVSTQLKGTRRVFVVPDGELHLVNLYALPEENGRFLVESGPLIHYLSAERDVVSDPERVAKGSGLLALGGPDFNWTGSNSHAAVEPPDAQRIAHYRGARSTCGDFASATFPSLPGSDQETDEIAALWQRANDEAGEGSQLLKGAMANEATLKNLAPGHRVLHLATHGFFLGQQCSSALDGRGIGGMKPADGQPPPVSGENPLLLSGLVLAGANLRDQAGPNEEDGILTAEEIASLDLLGVEWAVLSACDTGVGKVQVGEVFGLRRAFQVAGARTVIMSLWKVGDETTREWMKLLYEARFVRELSTADAVRWATREMLDEQRKHGAGVHPGVWAAFLAVGDWN